MENLKKRIQEALDNIRPYLHSDGGDVRLHEITEDMVVQVELLGNCGTCSMSPMTMRAGIEEAIKRVAPEIKGVTAITVN